MINDAFKQDGWLENTNQTEKFDVSQQNPNDYLGEQTRDDDLNPISMNHTSTSTTAMTTTTAMTSSSTTTLSLAYTSSRWITCTISLAILVTHGLFLYGQIQPMWKLTHYESIDIWWNATTTTSQWAFHTLGLPHDVHFQIIPTIINSSTSLLQPSNVMETTTTTTTTTSNTIQTFTYAFAIQELWEAKGMSAGIVVSRIAAMLLTLFSGIWPHVKLLSLLFMWWIPVSSTRRTTILQYLSAWGKWSLADIWVVCVLVGVLHLDWTVDPEAIRVGISNQLPQLIQIVQSEYNSTQLCTQLLHYDCYHPDHFAHRIPCDACTTAIDTAFWQPQWVASTGRTIVNGIATSGTGICNLRVVGMRGMYAFCAAVVISILLSVVVDILNYRQQQQQQYKQNHRIGTTTTTTTTTPLEDDEELTTAIRYQLMADDKYSGEEKEEKEHDTDDTDEVPLLSSQEDPIRSSLELEPSTDILSDTDNHVSNGRTIQSCCLTFLLCTLQCLLSFLALGLVVKTIRTKMLRRHVHGAIPNLLHDILSMEWEESYSLLDLSNMTGAAGGWDQWLLQNTFRLFLVFGPLALAMTFLVYSMTTTAITTATSASFCWRTPQQNPMITCTIFQWMIPIVGSFCAWEVWILAIFMIALLMPSITNTIVMNPQCQILDPTTGSCFMVDFEILPEFTYLLVAGIILLILWMMTMTMTTTKSYHPQHER